MLPKPDAQSLTRLKISLGLLLCALGLIGPALILRETSVLRISQKELDGLTQTARNELERRQHLSHTVGLIAPWIGGGVFLFGTGLIILAIPRLRSQEQDEERRTKAEVSKLESELRPKTEEEQRRSMHEDAEELSRPRSADISREVLASELRRTIQELNAQIESIRPRVFRFQSDIALRSDVHHLQLDGLLYSGIDQLHDVVIEHKVAGRSFSERSGINQAKMLREQYEGATDRAAYIWLVVLVEGEALPSSERVEDGVFVTRISRQKISDLTFPGALIG
jgi:hypothetical protein